jgi:phospholipid/cholesterol/gamma-HCH transport system ATP-binding protein
MSALAVAESIPGPTATAAVAWEAVEARTGGQGAALAEPLDAVLPVGAALVFTGPPGNGKSTALALAMGGLAPSAGSVKVFGQEPARLRPSALAKLRARIGYVPQRGALLSNLSLADNITLPLRWHRAVDDVTAAAALVRVRDRLELDEIPALPAGVATAAWRRLAALARALIAEPELLVLDEPAPELVGGARAQWWRLIGTFARREAPALSVLAATVDHDAARLVGGQVVALAGPSGPGTAGFRQGGGPR